MSTEIKDYIDWKDTLKVDEKTKAKIEAFFEDLTTLTITTEGADNEKIVTNIKLTGDVHSQTTLKGAKLIEYHEKMADASVNLLKTYAQIAITTISIFLPWAGLKIAPEALTSLKDAFSQISLSKQ